MLKSLRSARLLAELALFALGLPLVTPTVQACTMDRMEMDAMEPRYELIANERDAGGKADACHPSTKQETLQSLEHACCGDASVSSDAVSCDQGTNETAPLFCNCPTVDSSTVTPRTQDSAGPMLALHETGEERAPPVLASQTPRSCLNDPGSPPLDRTIVFGSFLT